MVRRAAKKKKPKSKPPPSNGLGLENRGSESAPDPTMVNNNPFASYPTNRNLPAFGPPVPLRPGSDMFTRDPTSFTNEELMADPRARELLLQHESVTNITDTMFYPVRAPTQGGMNNFSSTPGFPPFGNSTIPNHGLVSNSFGPRNNQDIITAEKTYMWMQSTNPFVPANANAPHGNQFAPMNNHHTSHEQFPQHGQLSQHGQPGPQTNQAMGRPPINKAEVLHMIRAFKGQFEAMLAWAEDIQQTCQDPIGDDLMAYRHLCNTARAALLGLNELEPVFYQ